MKISKLRATVALLIAMILGTTIGITAANAISLGGVLKGGAIVLLVDRFSDQLNSAVNTLTLNRNLPIDAATKVVPIISLGSGGYIGAAQVSGPESAVSTVKAVAQVEGNFSGDRFRLRGLVPISSRGTSNIKRVAGVGVSAIIDVKI